MILIEMFIIIWYNTQSIKIYTKSAKFVENQIIFIKITEKSKAENDINLNIYYNIVLDVLKPAESVSSQTN